MTAALPLHLGSSHELNSFTDGHWAQHSRKAGGVGFPSEYQIWCDFVNNLQAIQIWFAAENANPALKRSDDDALTFPLLMASESSEVRSVD